MITVKIITVGKLKENYLRDACAEYIKRIGGYCIIKLIELNECRLPDKPSQKEINKSLEAEGKMILKEMLGTYSIAMCIEGKQISSEELSSKIDNLAINGTSAVSFIIGSSFGLSDTVKCSVDFKLSMSKMTFPHQLARVMLLEQIYRSFQISAGTKYHK